MVEKLFKCIKRRKETGINWCDETNIIVKFMLETAQNNHSYDKVLEFLKHIFKKL